MSDYDLSNVPHLLARLDGPVPCDGALGVDEAAVIADRVEAAAAIRALMAERDVPVSATATSEWWGYFKREELVNGTDRFGSGTDGMRHAFEQAWSRAAAVEREECAEVCEDRAEQIAAREPKTIEAATEYEVWLHAARVIRARGAA